MLGIFQNLSHLLIALRHRFKGESHECSLKRHEHYLALKLRLRPEHKVGCWLCTLFLTWCGLRAQEEKFIECIL